MYRRDLHGPENKDALLNVPPLVMDRGERTEGHRSRIRRDGMRSLEIEVPRRGLTNVEYWILLGLLTLAFAFVLIGIPLAPTMIILNGVDDLPFLLFIVIPSIIILSVPSSVMKSSFTQMNVTITRESYCLTMGSITWKSLFKIMLIPSHFNDLESGQVVEAPPRQSQHDRERALRAQIVTQYRNRSESTDIKLGSISFAGGLDVEELQWLREEINRFLQETG